MGNKKHSELTASAEIHVPKGFTEANPYTAPIKNKQGELEWHDVDNWGAKVNFNATTNPDPAVNNLNEGYDYGSRWVNTVERRYFVCTDPTPGGCRWMEVVGNHSSEVDPTVNDDNTKAFAVSSIWVNTTTDTAFVCIDNTTGSARWITISSGDDEVIGISHPTLAELDSDDHLQYLHRDGRRPMIGALDMNTHQINNLVAGVAGTDAVNKNQLDAETSRAMAAEALLLLLDGSRAMTGNFNLGGHDIQNAGDINGGLINGVQITAHGARHGANAADPTPTAAPIQISASGSNSAGTANTLARSDHKHDILTDTPVQLLPETGNVDGTSIALARADHQHDIPTAQAVGLTANSTNQEGVALSFSRSDHTHFMLVGSPIQQLPDQVLAAGTDAHLARADHVHNIPTAVPVDIAGANAQGSAASFARSDHVHKGIHSLKVFGGTQRFNDLVFKPAYNTSITDDGAGNFTFDTLRGGNEFAVVSQSGLILTLTAGQVSFLGTLYPIVQTAVTLPANTTGILYIDPATHTYATASGSTPPPLAVPLYLFTTGPSSITSLTDRRVMFHPSVQYLAPSTQNADQANSAGSSNYLVRADHIHNIPTATPVSTGNANAQGTAGTFAKSDHVHLAVLQSYEQTGSTQFDTTNTVSFDTITGMSVTPVAGTYLVMYSCEVLYSNNGATRGSTTILLAGAEQTSSTRTTGTAGGAQVVNAGQKIITVNGSQAVALGVKSLAATVSVFNRSLTLIRIG